MGVTQPTQERFRRKARANAKGEGVSQHAPIHAQRKVERNWSGKPEGGERLRCPERK